MSDFPNSDFKLCLTDVRGEKTAPRFQNNDLEKSKKSIYNIINNLLIIYYNFRVIVFRTKLETRQNKLMGGTNLVEFILTRRLSGFKILYNATLIFQKWHVSRHFANIFHYLNFSEEYL